MRRVLLTVSFVLFTTVAVRAQTVVNPTTLRFVASAEHGVMLGEVPVVESYEMRIVTMINTTVVVWSFGLGKPVPDPTNVVTLPLPPLATQLMANTLYQARVAAIGPGGEGESNLSNPFGLLEAPSAPTDVRVE